MNDEDEEYEERSRRIKKKRITRKERLPSKEKHR